MFTTENFNVAEHQRSDSKYMAPGIQVARIQDLEHFVSKNGTESMKIVLINEEGKICETNWWMTEKSWIHTQIKLCIMAEVFGLRSSLDGIKEETAIEYTRKVNLLFQGNTGRWKLSGEEVAGGFDKEGGKKKNWVKAQIAPFGTFVEKLESESSMKFDESKDIKRLPKAHEPENKNVKVEVSDDLPF